jgi:hypothetical protein
VTIGKDALCWAVVLLVTVQQVNAVARRFGLADPPTCIEQNAPMRYLTIFTLFDIAVYTVSIFSVEVIIQKVSDHV